MSEHDREELKSLVMSAVVEALRDHPCRFGSAESAVLHETAKRLNADDVIVVAWLAHRLQGLGNTVGGWAAKLVVAGLIALLAAGAAAVAWGIRRGWVSPIAP